MSGYLDKVIHAEEDPRLQGSHHHGGAVPVAIQRPPGITTLRQWGKLVIPSGKHAGKTYEETHQDGGYVHQIWNRRAVSGWLRSFQMYCRKRQKADPVQDHVETMTATAMLPPEVPTRTMATPKPINKPKNPPVKEPSSEGWTKIEKSSAKTNPNKRGAPPRLPTPSSIHSPKDFNDCVGGDGVTWTNRQGRKFHFMHFIDEATLFHLGAPCGRTVGEQIDFFETVWLQWAGPCKMLYLDPAGEYVNDAWHVFLQRERIRLSAAAGESHWQIMGRAEYHGRILQQMLTAMDLEESITSAEDFRKALPLRQVFAAKTSLRNVGGFTPEQAVMGKSRALPASLVTDQSAVSHSLGSLAESSSSEGVLQRQPTKT